AVEREVGKKEAGKFLDKLKLVRLDAQAEQLRKTAKTIREMPIGLVADGVDDKFKVTPDLLVSKPEEAEKRFAELLAAMQTNATYLKAKQSELEEAHKYCKAAAKALTELNKGIEKAVAAGFFTNVLAMKYLDSDALIKAYNELAADAERAAKQAKTAAE